MNIASLDLNLLLVLEALLEERSVSRAAKRVGLTQPALSNALGRLRGALQDPLFVRKGGVMAPTPRAMALAEPVREGLARIRIALAPPPAFHPGTLKRTFVIGATDYAEVRVLGPVLAALEEKAPGVDMTLRRLDHVFLPPEEALARGEYDLAISFFPDAKALPAPLYSIDLFTEKNVLLSARRNEPKTVEEYASRTHVATFYSTGSPGLIDNLLAARSMRREQIVRVPHFLSVPFLVAGSSRVAVVPEGVAAMFRHSLQLAVSPVPLELPDFAMRMVWHRSRSSDEAHRWLRELIAAVKLTKS